MNELQQEILTIFETLGLRDYTITEHEAIYTSEEAEKKGLILEGITPKNLLLRKKKTDRYFMVMSDWRRPADLKALKPLAVWGQVRFAREEEMIELTGVGAGALSPLALCRDRDHQITVVMAKEIAGAESETRINVHPGRNTATLSMWMCDLMRYLEHLGCSIICEE
ncbi:MAG: hypothetical protein IJ109_06650 [Firmicutes bacterium]|nr:hypothetical protein [Bacillota bacterium]